MSKTRRVNLKLDPDEAVVVGPIHNFETLRDVCLSFGDMKDHYSEMERMHWRATAAWLQGWLDQVEVEEEY